MPDVWKSRDGSVYHVDDYVLLMSENPGEPFFVGRIMEFVDTKSVKIAWFYRPQDVLSQRKNYDSRMLLASMHSDINPTRAIVGKCVVKHLSYVSGDLDAYRLQDAHYYYAQLYDRFTKKVYEVVPTSHISNRPPQVLQRMRQFEFVLVEEGRQAEFTSNYKECRLCAQWMPPEDGRDCVTCGKSYHNACIGNVKKMLKGYRWQCHFCTTGTSPIGIPETASSVELDATLPLQDGKEELSDMVMPIKKKTPFPFTYYGAQCSNQDAFELDPEHPFYPRLASRVGIKYQAHLPRLLSVLPTEDEIIDEESKQIQHLQQELEKLKRKVKKTPKILAAADEYSIEPVEMPQRAMDLIILQNMGLPANTNPTVYLGIKPARGLDNNLVCDATEPSHAQAVEEYISQLKVLGLPLEKYNTSLLDRAAYEIQQTQFNVEEALNIMSKLSEQDINDGTYPVSIAESIQQIRGWASTERALSCNGDAIWTEEERLAFRKGVEEHGHDLLSFAQSLPSKNMRQIVKYFYTWKQSSEQVYALRTFMETHNHKERSPQNQYLMSTAHQQHTSAPKGTTKHSRYGAAANERLDSDDDRGSAHSVASSLSELSSDDEPDEEVVPTPPEGQCTNCKSTETRRFIRTNLILDPQTKFDRARDRDLKTVISAEMATFGEKETRGYQIFCEDCGEYWLKYGAVKYVYEEPKQRGYRGRRKNIDIALPDANGVRTEDLTSRPSAADSGTSVSSAMDITPTQETTIAIQLSLLDATCTKSQMGRRKRSQSAASAFGHIPVSPLLDYPPTHTTELTALLSKPVVREPKLLLPRQEQPLQPIQPLQPLQPSGTIIVEGEPKRKRGRKRASLLYDFTNDMIPIDQAVPGEEPTDAEIVFQAQSKRKAHKRSRTEPTAMQQALEVVTEEVLKTEEDLSRSAESLSLVSETTTSTPTPLTPCCLCTEGELPLLLFAGMPADNLKSITVPASGVVSTANDNDNNGTALISEQILEQASPENVLLIPANMHKNAELIRCADCGMCVHEDCYGVDHVPRKWRCSPCLNVRQPVAATSYACVLCPANQPLDMPLPLKRTVGHNWVHFICALWTPEIFFGNAMTLEPVEGVEMIPAQRWQQLCYVCNTYGGATIACADQKCKRTFHIACAHRVGYFFGLIEGSDSNRALAENRQRGKPGSTSIQTRSAPAIWCRDHVIPEDALDVPKQEKKRGRKPSMVVGMPASGLINSNQEPLYELRTKTGEVIKFLSHEIFAQVLQHVSQTKIIDSLRGDNGGGSGGVARGAYIQQLMASRRPTSSTSTLNGSQKTPIGTVSTTYMDSSNDFKSHGFISPTSVTHSRSSSGRMRKPTAESMYTYDQTWERLPSTQSHSSVGLQSPSDAGFAGLKIKLKLITTPKNNSSKNIRCAICNSRASPIWWSVDDTISLHAIKPKNATGERKCHRCFSQGK